MSCLVIYFESFASTIGIATGNRTSDGRPLLFKNKDRTDNYPSDVNYYNGGNTYFSYVFQQNDGQDHTRARMGINTAGFGIVYSDSENLEGAPTGPYGSQLTAVALKTCATIDDFRNLLDDTNGERRVHNHFAVIDSSGEGAMFEVDGYSYVEIPVIDSIGTMANTAKYHPDRGAPASGSTSPQRESRAMYLMTHCPEQGLDYKYFTNEVVKDFCETQQDEDEMPVGQYYTNPVLSRYKTAAGCVIQGIKPGGNSLVESVMWLCLSEPSLSVALPFFVNVSQIPDFIRSDSYGDGIAGSSDRIRQLVYDYSGGRYSDRYADTFALYDIRESTFKIQESLFIKYEEHLPVWLEQSQETAVESMELWMNEIHSWAKSKYDSLYVVSDVADEELNKTVSYNLLQNYPNPFNSSTIIKYSIFAGHNNYNTSSLVSIRVYDVLGKEVAELVNKQQMFGTHNIIFNARLLSAGHYFYTIEVAGYSETKKMVCLK
jgi:hypothetical protein